MDHSEMYEDLNMLSEAQKPLLKVLLGNRGSKNKICPFEMYDFKLWVNTESVSEMFAIISLDYLDYKSKHFFSLKQLYTSKNCHDGINVEKFWIWNSGINYCLWYVSLIL